MHNSCDIHSFIGLNFISQHIYLCVKHVFAAWYLCAKCTNLWMNEFFMIYIVNLLHAKFVMYETNMHTNFVPHLIFPIMPSLEKIWTTKFMWWFIQCTLIRNGAFGCIYDWGTKKKCLIKNYKGQLWIFSYLTLL